MYLTVFPSFPLSDPSIRHHYHLFAPLLSLSWADTAASTIGRLYGSSTPPLPPQTPILRLPLAPRKSSAGFVAATLTGTSFLVRPLIHLLFPPIWGVIITNNTVT